MLLADAEVLNPDLYAAEGCAGTLLAPPVQPMCRLLFYFILFFPPLGAEKQRFCRGKVLERRSSRRSRTTGALSLLSGDKWACFYTFLLNKEAA